MPFLWVQRYFLFWPMLKVRFKNPFLQLPQKDLFKFTLPPVEHLPPEFFNTRSFTRLGEISAWLADISRETLPTHSLLPLILASAIPGQCKLAESVPSWSIISS